MEFVGIRAAEEGNTKKKKENKKNEEINEKRHILHYCGVLG